jgi:hypothetical protein
MCKGPSLSSARRAEIFEHHLRGLKLAPQLTARGQSRTEGLHERRVLVSGKARKRLLGRPDERIAMGLRAMRQVH